MEFYGRQIEAEKGSGCQELFLEDDAGRVTMETNEPCDTPQLLSPKSPRHVRFRLAQLGAGEEVGGGAEFDQPPEVHERGVVADAGGMLRVTMTME